MVTMEVDFYGKNVPNILDLSFPALQGTPHIGDYVRLDEKTVKEEIYSQSVFADPASRIGRVIYINPHRWFLMEMINCNPSFVLCEDYIPEEWERDFSRTFMAAEDFGQFNATMAMTYGLTSEEEPDYEDEEQNFPSATSSAVSDAPPMAENDFDDLDDTDELDDSDPADGAAEDITLATFASLADCNYDQSEDTDYDAMDY